MSAAQTPLHELLQQIPSDIRIGVQDGEGWQAGTSWHPVGAMCQEAAAELLRLKQSEREGWRYADELEQERKRLHALNQELLKACRTIVDAFDALPQSDQARHSRLHINTARSAIANASGNTTCSATPLKDVCKPEERQS